MPGVQATHTPPSAAPAAQPARAGRAIGSYVLRAALGIGILSLVLSRINLRQLLHLLTRERPAYFIAATAIYVAGQMIAYVPLDVAGADDWNRGQLRGTSPVLLYRRVY